MRFKLIVSAFILILFSIMNTYSRALRHISMKDVKQKHQQKLIEQKIREEKKKEEEKYIASVMEEKRYSWKKEINEQMTTNDIFFTTLQPVDGDLLNNEAVDSVTSLDGVSIENTYITFNGGDTYTRSAFLTPVNTLGSSHFSVTVRRGDDSSIGVSPSDAPLILYYLNPELDMKSYIEIGVLSPARESSWTEVPSDATFEDITGSDTMIDLSEFVKNGLTQIQISEFRIKLNNVTSISPFYWIKYNNDSFAPENEYVYGTLTDVRRGMFLEPEYQALYNQYNGATVAEWNAITDQLFAYAQSYQSQQFPDIGDYSSIFDELYQITGGAETFSDKSILLPSSARGKNVLFRLSQVATVSYPANEVGIHNVSNIKLRRQTPLNVFVPLDSPEANSFIRSEPNLSNLSPQGRQQKIKEMLEASDEYVMKFLGLDFPGTGAVPPGEYDPFKQAPPGEAGDTPGVEIANRYQPRGGDFGPSLKPDGTTGFPKPGEMNKGDDGWYEYLPGGGWQKIPSMGVKTAQISQDTQIAQIQPAQQRRGATGVGVPDTKELPGPRPSMPGKMNYPPEWTKFKNA